MSRTAPRPRFGFMSRTRLPSAVSRCRCSTSANSADGLSASASARPRAVWHCAASRAMILSYSRVLRDFSGVVTLSVWRRNHPGIRRSAATVLPSKKNISRSGMLTWKSELAVAAPLHLLVPREGHLLVVHHPDGLHERIADRRSDEPKAALLELLAHRVRLRRARRQVTQGAEGVPLRGAADEMP